MTRPFLVAALILAACGSGDPAEQSSTVTRPPETTLTSAATTTMLSPAAPTESTTTETPTTSTVPPDAIQSDNPQATEPMEIRPASALPIDARLGVGLYPAYPDLVAFDYLLTEFLSSGVHRIDISYSDIEYPVDWSYSETEIDPAFDQLINNLDNKDIAVDYMLHFWDKEGHAVGEEMATPRFQTEDQIQDFIDYLSDIVERYRGQIQYYTIWSEPDACGAGGIKCIEPADYIALSERVIPVIRELDPDAKVAIAPVVLFHARDYMATLLESDVIDEFDVIQWHGIYNVIPDDTAIGRYYNDYPAIVAEIKDRAAANGFTGEFWCTEITFCDSDKDPGCPSPDPPLSDLQVAKYYARSLVLHLGLDIGTSYKTYRDTSGPVTFAVFGRLHTLLSGTTPAEIAVEVDTEANDVATVGFMTPRGDRMLALWIDQMAVGDHTTTGASLTFTGMAGKTATGFDVISGVRQQLRSVDNGADLVVSDLLIGDGPFFVRLED